MRRTIGIIGIALLVSAMPASAGVPRLDAVYPPGGARGTTTRVLLRGQDLSGVDRILVSGEGVTTRPEPAPTLAPKAIEKPEATEKKEGEEEIAAAFVVAADAQPGVREIRVVSPRGSSNVGYFCVGMWPEREEVEPNDIASSPQVLNALPVTINGRLGQEADVDRYVFTASQGEMMVITIDSTSFHSPVDPQLELLDPSGRRITRMLERSGRDLRLLYPCRRTGRHTLILRDVNYRSGPQYTYRLTVGRLPLVTRVVPRGGRAGTKIAARVEGVNLGDMRLIEVNLPTSPSDGRLTVVPDTPNGPALPITFFAGEEPEMLETEPNDTPSQATRLPGFPLIVNGAIDRPGDVDTYRFRVSTVRKLSFEVFADRLGARLDSTLKVLNLSGRQLATDDDSAGIDPRLQVEFPVSTDYLVQVRSVDGEGGADYFYRLRAGPADGPDFSLTTTPSNPNLGRGGAAKVTVRAVRKNGFDGPISVHVDGLPTGVTVSPGLIRNGRDFVQMTLSAAPDADLGVANIRVVGEAKIEERTVTRTAAPKDRGPDDEDYFPANRDATLHVATVAEVPFTLRLEPDRVTLKPGEKVKLKVKAMRRADAPEGKAKIDLHFSEMPEGVRADLKPIEEGKDEVEIEISATDKAPSVTEPLVLSTNRGRNEIAAPALILTVGE